MLVMEGIPHTTWEANFDVVGGVVVQSTSHSVNVRSVAGIFVHYWLVSK